jgi:hypothetical protein
MPTVSESEVLEVFEFQEAELNEKNEDDDGQSNSEGSQGDDDGEDLGTWMTLKRVNGRMFIITLRTLAFAFF